ncbi:MAG: hypothetical protein U9O55_02980 [Patescibacteria group bacterium]|nr:hypothetical protein [Patescibacteria group bacterium]
MKPKIIMAIFLLLVFSAFSSAMACDPSDPSCQQTADGYVYGGGLYEHGDSNFGGYSMSEDMGEYHAVGTNYASGYANLGSVLKGDSCPNGLSWSRSKIATEAGADGNIEENTHIAGYVGQGNWSNIDREDDNFARGINITNAEYEGENGPYIDGSADACGRTFVNVAENNDGNILKRTSSALTIGASKADQTRDGEVKIDGEGEHLTGSRQQNDSVDLSAGNHGTFCYDGSAPNTIAGVGITVGKSVTTTEVFPDGINFKAKSKSRSKGNII